MSEKHVLFMARTTRFHEFARTLTSTLGAEVYVATPDSPSVSHDFDLLILDADVVVPEGYLQAALAPACPHRLHLLGRQPRRARGARPPAHGR